jgi:hypothetical protein
MRAKTKSRLIVSAMLLLAFSATATSVSANERAFVPPWMTIGEDPYLYYGPHWGPLSETWPYSGHPGSRPSSRRVTGPRVPFPGAANRPEPPFVGGCPPGLTRDRRPIGPPGFVPPPFAPPFEQCAVSP